MSTDPACTLFLTPRQTSDAQALWRAAIARGWDVERLTTWQIPDDIGRSARPVLYVEALFGPTLAEQLGVGLHDPAQDWLPRLPIEYRRRDVRLTTLDAARTLTTPIFTKPPNDKSFPAKVYLPGELSSDFDGSMSVLVAEPVEFDSEFRCFVLDRQVRTFSIYCREGELVDGFVHTPQEAVELFEFLGRFLKDPRVEIPKACVIDCGVIQGRGWAIVEQNAAWGAGLYACDPDLALDVISAATVVNEDLRPPADVARRCLALFVVAMLAESIRAGNSMSLDDLRSDFPLAFDAMTADESRWVRSPSTSASMLDSCIDRYESLFALAWALGVLPSLDFPSHRSDVSARLQPLLKLDPETFVREAKFRPVGEILDSLRQHAEWHRMLNDAVDESVGARLGANLRVVGERYHALRWVLGSEWSDPPLLETAT